MNGDTTNVRSPGHPHAGTAAGDTAAGEMDGEAVELAAVIDLTAARTAKALAAAKARHPAGRKLRDRL